MNSKEKKKEKKNIFFCGVCWVRNTDCHDLVTPVSIITDIYKELTFEGETYCLCSDVLLGVQLHQSLYPVAQAK